MEIYKHCFISDFIDNLEASAQEETCYLTGSLYFISGDELSWPQSHLIDSPIFICYSEGVAQQNYSDFKSLKERRHYVTQKFTLSLASLASLESLSFMFAKSRNSSFIKLTLMLTLVLVPEVTTTQPAETTVSSLTC